MMLVCTEMHSVTDECLVPEAPRSVSRAACVRDDYINYR